MVDHQWRLATETELSLHPQCHRSPYTSYVHMPFALLVGASDLLQLESSLQMLEGCSFPLEPGELHHGAVGDPAAARVVEDLRVVGDLD